MKSENLASLNGLRAVAVWLVFVHHFPPFEAGSLAFFIAKQGYVGVSLFFVLSGFLIAHRYYESAELHTLFLKNYFYKRWLRIYPLFWLIVTASFIVIWLVNFEFSAKEYVLSISFLKGFSNDYKFTGLSQTWSLTVEVCFYLLAPLLFVLHKRFDWFWCSLAFCYLAGLALWDISIGFETPHFVIFYTFFGRAFDFFVGFGIWLLLEGKQSFIPAWAGYPDKIGTGWVTSHISHHFTNALLPTCIIVLAFEDYYQFDETYFSFNYIELIINNLVLPVSIGLLIYKIIGENSSSKWLSAPVIQLLGKSSYVFFLIHLGPLSKLMAWTGWIGYFIVVNVLSVLIYWFVERNINKILKR